MLCSTSSTINRPPVWSMLDRSVRAYRDGAGLWVWSRKVRACEVTDGETTAGAATGWVRTEHSAGLSGRRNRDTGPELVLRREVHRLGLRFRLHQRLAGRFSVDFALPRFRVAVLVDGCFWHGCPDHGPAEFRGPNRERWAAKLAENRDRDARCDRALAQAGWRVVRFWECAVRADAAGCARVVETLCREGRLLRSEG